ncbi:MAG: DUF3788 family protein [Ignavibacteriales bacterium]
MEAPVLTDQNVFPTEEIIFSHIGKSSALWNLVFEHIHKTYPGFEEHWRYYNDGKSWLLKVTQKTKTIFWLSVSEGAFRMTFYFTARAEEAILKSSISGELKKMFTEGKSYNKIRGITIVFKRKKDVEDAKALIQIKLSVK